MIDVKTVYLHKKLICIFIVCTMLVSGIHVTEAQGDSFFAFLKDKNQRVSIENVFREIEPVRYILKHYNDFYEEHYEKINQKKANHRGMYMICPKAILNVNLFSKSQKMDVRLWQPGRLTDAFIILFIHHQDGLKRRIPLLEY